MELPHLKWATLMFLLSLGMFPLGFYSVYPLTSILWIQVSGCIEDKGLHCSASLLERPLYYFIPKPEYWPRHLGCDWCRPAVAFWKYSFRSHCPDICPEWRIYGPWRKPAFCGKDTGLYTCPGETKEASTFCRSGKSLMAPWPQPRRSSTLWTVDLDLGNKAMLANPLLPWLGKEIYRFKGCMMLWNFHPFWESLKTWNGHMSPWDFWLISELKGFSVIWSL
jgi:hypothetical protein